MGDPLHVPAGKYAEEALHSVGWYEDLKSRILPAKDVRSALMVVEMSECEMGIVYYSDAIRSQKVKIIGIFPEHTHEPIIFHAILHKDASESSLKFFNFLTDKSIESIWVNNGFKPVKP